MTDKFQEPLNDGESDGDQFSETSPEPSPLTENIIRYATPVITIVLIGVVALVLSRLVDDVKPASEVDLQATAAAIAEPTLNAASGLSPDGAEIPAIVDPSQVFSLRINRKIEPNTTIPNRARVNISTYTVQRGDSVFSIADQFGLRPETILWGNYASLKDNVRELSVDQELNILPTDGTFHRYSVGESLTSIGSFYQVDPEAIITWPGNNLDPYETDPDSPNISDGSWLIIPGGQRELQDWGPPPISRNNPAAAAYYGDGYCGEITEGPVGNGTFMWPTPGTYISGFDYNAAIHPGIDIGGAEGNAIFATDTGVVVFAGWSNYGYGYMIVLDHGSGWQSAYAHLAGVGVFCGQGVAQGTVIGQLGNTGNSSGAHLHFELYSSLYGKVNPWNFLIKP